MPRVPLLEGARRLIWSLLALAALSPLCVPPGPADLGVLKGERGCRLGELGSGLPCPCAEIPAQVRMVLGWPLPLNRSDARALQRLPGVGPARAAAIVAERGRGGGFAVVADLAPRVRGIGPVSVARLRPWLFTGERDPACAEPAARSPEASSRYPVRPE